MTAITLNLHSVVDLTDEQFSKLCQANPDIKLERTAKGELIEETASPSLDVLLEHTKGIWMQEDGLAYQQAIRGEW